MTGILVPDWLQVLAFLVGVVLIGFLLALGSCALLLPMLRRFQLRQRAYEDAPETHQRKTGTPTMGGICFIIALVPVLFFGASGSNLPLLFTAVALCGLIGIVDDLLAIRLGRNRGLRARTKFLLTALVAVMFLRAMTPFQNIETVFGPYRASSSAPVDVLLTLPHFTLFAPHWLWLILGIIAITGSTHAVNLTDGLDGLAAGTMIFPLAFFAIVGVQFATGGVGSLPALLGIGACLGFLVYNRHPAKLIMGDTGSLALGALLSAVAIISGEMLLLMVVGFVFVAEMLSVMLQVGYFKLTHGKRIFKMSPLHHHFELLGWPETKVTTRFWIASALCSAVGLAIVR